MADSNDSRAVVPAPKSTPQKPVSEALLNEKVTRQIASAGSESQQTNPSSFAHIRFPSPKTEDNNQPNNQP
jgi:hypothetical protein